MKRKKISLFEEIKIQMVMKIYNISRSKAIEYIAEHKVKIDECSKNDEEKEPKINTDDEYMFDSVEDFFMD
jgi:ribosome-associated protein YbcJ (S4-like RNA binding protein)